MSDISKFQFEQMRDRLAASGVAQTGVTPLPPPLEKKLHEDIIEFCDQQWPRWKYVHSRTDKPTRNECGVPDFIIAMPGGKSVYIEAKRPGEKLSPAQRDWHAEMEKIGHHVHVVHTMLEFLIVVQQEKKI